MFKAGKGGSVDHNHDTGEIRGMKEIPSADSGYMEAEKAEENKSLKMAPYWLACIKMTYQTAKANLHLPTAMFMWAISKIVYLMAKEP